MHHASAAAIRGSAMERRWSPFDPPPGGDPAWATTRISRCLKVVSQSHEQMGPLRCLAPGPGGSDALRIAGHRGESPAPSPGSPCGASGPLAGDRRGLRIDRAGKPAYATDLWPAESMPATAGHVANWRATAACRCPSGPLWRAQSRLAPVLRTPPLGSAVPELAQATPADARTDGLRRCTLGPPTQPDFSECHSAR